MRLLLVSDSYPPLIGGATRATALTAKALAERGHEVWVATSDQPGAPAHEVDEQGVRIHRLPGLVTRAHVLSADQFRRIPPPFADPETTLRFRRLLRRARPDVVHAYGWMTYSCLLALGRSGTPVVVSARDYGFTCPIRTMLHRSGETCRGPAWRKCLACAPSAYSAPKAGLAVAGVLGGRRIIRRRAAATHYVSHYVQGVMRRDLPAAPGMIEAIIPDFRAPATDEPVDDALLAGLPSEPFILFVGALRRIKGVHELLEAYAMLRDAPALVMIGTRAPDTPAFPTGVTVLYDVPNATVMAAWERAAFGVFPSVLPEPLGNVVHEAMSRGRAVIGTRPGGHVDMVDHGRSGLIVASGDVPALAGAMQTLVDDPALAEAMGRAGAETAARFDQEPVVDALEALYARVVARPPAEARATSPTRTRS